MGQAHDVATSATSAVTQAKAKVEDAHNGLDAPAPGASSPAHTAPQAASGGHSTPSAQTVSYHPNGHASSSMSHGGSYSGGSGSSGGESSGTPADYHPRPITGNKAEWIAQAREILIGMGYPPEAIDDDAISIIIDGESGGNPNAINGSDSNAAAGHPSMGLMQTIQSTFDAHAAPGHTDIMNPVDNIVAATRYSMDRYGGLDNVPGVQAVRHGGSYVGY
ncbi:MAG: transglycosylase SLT domain-containing protein [Nocardia sp.]|nr:transglycosylase SLT domain-containing protein [Nocardia sp.]